MGAPVKWGYRNWGSTREVQYAPYKLQALCQYVWRQQSLSRQWSIPPCWSCFCLRLDRQVPCRSELFCHLKWNEMDHRDENFHHMPAVCPLIVSDISGWSHLSLYTLHHTVQSQATIGILQLVLVKKHTPLHPRFSQDDHHKWGSLSSSSLKKGGLNHRIFRALRWQQTILKWAYIFKKITLLIVKSPFLMLLQCRVQNPFIFPCLT